jgi:hypothetical protein
LGTSADTWYNSTVEMTARGTHTTHGSATGAASRAYLWTWRFS